MKRDCDGCKKSFEAKGRSRFCQRAECLRERARARKRTQRGRVVELRPLVENGETDGSLAAAARAELEVAGRLDSLLGRLALHLAQHLDAGTAVGTTISALHKELRATMEAALATAEAAGPVDELRRKRLERLGHGA